MIPRWRLRISRNDSDIFSGLFEGNVKDNLKMFRSESIVIGDPSFRAKLASVMGRLQIHARSMKANHYGDKQITSWHL